MADTFTPEQITQILEEFFKVVGTRRYVGERYVPIFGRKGEESIQWDNSAPYEPLTIVLYQGNSYTSRQYVPIGVEITNQEFWVITGNYNAQVEAYHRETIAAREIADNAITTANNAQNDINTLLPKADFSAENTVKKYIDENPTRILTFDTVADMQAATMLKSGMVCHTNGFHAIGDGGAAYYKVSASGTANGMDVLALQGGLYANLIVTDEYVTPQMFGAKGDGVTDNTLIFDYAQKSGHNIFVPKGAYVLTDFDFSTSITWTFQRAKVGQWFAGDTCAYILTDTTTLISAGPKINNLVIKYNGSISDVSLRPSCIKMKSHFCEIHGLWQSGWYVGLDFGVNASSHCDYTKIYDAYCLYNYFAGVRLAGSSSAQVNFISFYDCNMGSNGMDVHDASIAPNTSRGYGFYIDTANAIAIHNGDFSSNETCAFYINNSSASKIVKGLFIGGCYAEHNKYCNIYYENNNNSSQCRTGIVSINAPYFYNNNDQYFVGNVHADYPYIPKCVDFFGCPKSEYEDGSSLLLDVTNKMFSVDIPMNAKNFSFFGERDASYDVTLKLRGVSTGTLTIQNVVYSAYLVSSDGLYFYKNDSRLAALQVSNVSVVQDEEVTVSMSLTMPDSADSKIVYYTASGYGADAIVIDGSVKRTS